MPTHFISNASVFCRGRRNVLSVLKPHQHLKFTNSLISETFFFFGNVYLPNNDSFKGVVQLSGQSVQLLVQRRNSIFQMFARDSMSEVSPKLTKFSKINKKVVFLFCSSGVLQISM